MAVIPAEEGEILCCVSSRYHGCLYAFAQHLRRSFGPGLIPKSAFDESTESLRSSFDEQGLASEVIELCKEVVDVPGASETFRKCLSFRISKYEGQRLTPRPMT